MTEETLETESPAGELPVNVSADGDSRRRFGRIIEAVLFASPTPVLKQDLVGRLPVGTDIDAVLQDLQRHTRRNFPRDIRIAVPYYKPKRNQTDRVPDYFVHETEAWLKFPHSLEGLTEGEMREHRPNLAHILAQADQYDA